jgi:murein DD-endopeptidase MepM/ murein hydrolase activator NlpD
MKIKAQVAINRARLGLAGYGAGDGPGLLYQFYPQGGTLYKDLTTGNFVDLDPSAGNVQNYLCEHYGNDGHAGCDTGGGSWEEMAIGQPIFAALDGTVVATHDGDPDMNTSCESGGNFVIINHGGGRETWYLHMKRDSVAVSVGAVVKAGQQIGLVGSSGCSFGPHLHFQSMQNSSVYEPFAGACRSGASGFTKQIDPPAAPFLRDFGATNQDIGAAPPLPARPP